MGVMPRLVTMGSRMGDRMMVAGMLSMRQPTPSSSRLMSSSSKIRLSVTPRMAPAMRAGIFSMVR